MTSKFPSNCEDTKIIGSANQAIAFILRAYTVGVGTKVW